jgi:glycerol-1-phosphatase
MQALNNSWDVLRAYERIRYRLPTAPIGKVDTQNIKDFNQVIDQYDTYFFDAFGVLNIGETVLPGAVERIHQLQKLGKKTILVSNAASQKHDLLLRKYHMLGFNFDSSSAVFSRETLVHHWYYNEHEVVGLVGLDHADYSDLPFQFILLKDDLNDYLNVDHFVFLSSAQWSSSRQAKLAFALAQRPRPVSVANPDLVAPRENGMTLEPGFFVYSLNTDHITKLDVFGKPYTNIFELALRKSMHKSTKNKVLMVGDTLHTDIMGGKAMGFDTMLLTKYGASRGLDLKVSLESTGIYPNFVLEHI